MSIEHDRVQAYVAVNAIRIADDKLDINKPGAPERAGYIWHSNEDTDLRLQFTLGMGIANMAINHRRSKLAIECRLIKLGLVDEKLQPLVHRDANTIGEKAHTIIFDDISDFKCTKDNLQEAMYRQMIAASHSSNPVNKYRMLLCPK